jgi:hypothetical protein
MNPVNDYPVSRSMLRLYRFFHALEYLFTLLITKKEQTPLTDIVKTSYNQCLSTYHSMALKMNVGLLLNNLPLKKSIYKSLMGTEVHIEVVGRLGKFLDVLKLFNIELHKQIELIEHICIE